MTVFLLIAGSHHGGWWYQPLVELLDRAGHSALAPTLAGLEPDAGPPRNAINLDDHIEQAFNVLDKAAADGGSGEVRDAVLVGHSYGGSVISGVADRLSQRVRALVYLDALLPEDGDSSWSMTNDEERRWYIDGARQTGTSVDPLPFFDSRARPHPLATLMQASKLTGQWRSVPVKHFVEATEWPGESPMRAMADRARSYPDFTVHSWTTTHNVLRDGPERVFELIEGL